MSWEGVLGLDDAERFPFANGIGLPRSKARALVRAREDLATSAA